MIRVVNRTDLMRGNRKIGTIAEAVRTVGPYEAHGWEVRNMLGATVYWGSHYGDLLIVGGHKLIQQVTA